MKYDKPEVVKMANAVYAIQSEVKSNPSLPDSEEGGIYETVGAYEADE
jgi:hypothetical protein